MKMNMKNWMGIIIGALLIAIGVLYLLQALGVEVSLSLDGWWTLFIILPALHGLLTNRKKLWDLVVLAIGVLLLLAARDVIDYDLVWKIAVPAVVVALGIRMIVKSVSPGGEDAPAETDSQP